MLVNSSHREKLKNTTELQFHQGVSRELRFHFLKPFSGGHVVYPGDPQCGCMAAEAIERLVRKEYMEQLKRTVHALEVYGASCTGCVAVFVTPAAQHFPTQDGAYTAIKMDTQTAAGNATCTAWGAELPRADSPNMWRGELAFEVAPWVAREAPHVVTVPIHRLSRTWHDAHPNLRKPVGSHKLALDCTHLCFVRWRFVPLWWAIKEAHEACAETVG
jgi:hypothetical protein